MRGYAQGCHDTVALEADGPEAWREKSTLSLGNPIFTTPKFGRPLKWRRYATQLDGRLRAHWRRREFFEGTTIWQ